MDFKYFSLDLTSESRIELLDNLPNLHVFQSVSCFNQSSIHLDEIKLLRSSALKDEEYGELASELVDKYLSYIQENKTSFKIKLTHIGWTDGVIAFKCDNELCGLKPDEQILVASTYEYHRASDAKKITHWIEIVPIVLDGVLKLHK